MALYEDMHQLIGNTPLVKLGHLGLPENVHLFAKLELFNPSGSVKDRIGKYMIEDAEQRGILRKGSTIVEATAGNTGLGIAFAALNKGYRIIFVVPTKFSEEKQTLLRALGAEIINTPREEGMLGAWRKAEEIRNSISDAVTLEQFKNQANPRAHYETTGCLPIRSVLLWAAARTATMTSKASATILSLTRWICRWLTGLSRSAMGKHFLKPVRLLKKRGSLQVRPRAQRWQQQKNWSTAALMAISSSFCPTGATVIFQKNYTNRIII